MVDSQDAAIFQSRLQTVSQQKERPAFIKNTTVSRAMFNEIQHFTAGQWLRLKTIANPRLPLQCDDLQYVYRN